MGRLQDRKLKAGLVSLVVGASLALALPALADASSSYPVVLCGSGTGAGSDAMFWHTTPGVNGHFTACGSSRRGPGWEVVSQGRRQVRGGLSGGFRVTAPAGLSFTGLSWGGEFEGLGGWSAKWRAVPVPGGGHAFDLGGGL